MQPTEDGPASYSRLQLQQVCQQLWLQLRRQRHQQPLHQRRRRTMHTAAAGGLVPATGIVDLLRKRLDCRLLAGSSHADNARHLLGANPT